MKNTILYSLLLFGTLSLNGFANSQSLPSHLFYTKNQVMQILSDYQKENEKLRNVLQNQEDTFRAVIDVKNMGIDLLQDKLQNLIRELSDALKED